MPTPNIHDAPGHWIVHLRHDKLGPKDYKEGLVDRVYKDSKRMNVLYVDEMGNTTHLERIFDDNEIVWLRDKEYQKGPKKIPENQEPM